MRSTKFNEQLLRKVQQFIRETPEELIHNSKTSSLEAIVCKVHDGKPCPEGEVEQRAAKLLKIEYNNKRTYTEADQLFYPSMFPEKYRAEFNSTSDRETQKLVYLDWIDEFIRLKQVGELSESTELLDSMPTPDLKKKATSVAAKSKLFGWMAGRL